MPRPPLSPEKEKFAREIAHALNELHSLSNHRNVVRIYSEENIRKALSVALNMPEDKVIVSRGAIFMSRLKDYARYPGN